jgi:hypothetical protein
MIYEFVASVPLDIEWEGLKFVGPAGTVFRINYDLYARFLADIAPRIKGTLTWRNLAVAPVANRAVFAGADATAINVTLNDLLAKMRTSGMISQVATQMAFSDQPANGAVTNKTILSVGLALPDKTSLVTTDAAHGLVTGQVVLFKSTDSTPVLDGRHAVIVETPTTLRVPVAVTAIGTGAGSLDIPVTVGTTVVTIQDDLGGTCSHDYSTVVTLSWTVANPGCTLGGVLTRTAVAGVCTWDDLTVDKATAGVTITATMAGPLTVASSAITIT